MKISLHALFILVAVALQGQAKFDHEAIDQWTLDLMESFQVPGVSVAIVSSSDIEFMKGYGVRMLGGEDPVDENTLFGIASISKSFTGLGLALLEADGRINWQDKVINYLPNFQMSDPWVTKEMTIMDLLTHRSGLTSIAGGTLWYGSDYDRNEVIQRLRYLQPVSSFRSKFDYQNIMYMVAGEIIPAVTDTAWDEFMQHRIFAPLGMVTSNTSITAFAESSNVAQAHAILDGELQMIELRNHDNISAAAGINSTSQELCYYLQTLLGDGVFQHEQVFSPDVTEELWLQRIPLKMKTPRPAEESAFTPVLYRSYGLGWIMVDHRGSERVYHSGGIDGLRSLVTMIPEKDLGIIVLANNESREMVYALTEIILDMAWGIETYPWVQNVIDEARADDLEWQDEISLDNIKRNKWKRPSFKARELVGKYESKAYGQIEITGKRRDLGIRFTHTPSLTGKLSHWEGNTYLIKWLDPYIPRGFVTFQGDGNNKASGMELDQPELLDVDFTELHPILRME